MVCYVIDIGTNSTRLLKAEIKNGIVTPIYKQLRTVRTGEGVNSSGRLCRPAIDRTVSALTEYSKIISDDDDSLPVFCFATSAVRDSENSDVLLREAKEKSGIDIRILSGDEEARCGYAGVISPGGTGGILDIGGGSTEVVYGVNGKILYAHSFNVGCVRALELFSDKTPEHVIKWAEDILYKGDYSNFSENNFFAIGGTATALAALDIGLKEYQPDKVEHYRLTPQLCDKWLERLYKMTPKEREYIMNMEPRRSEIIVYGIAILRAFFNVSGLKDVLASDVGNMEGYIKLQYPNE